MPKVFGYLLCSAVLVALAPMGACGGKQEPQETAAASKTAKSPAPPHGKKSKRGKRRGKRRHGRGKSGADNHLSVCQRVLCTEEQLAKIKPVLDGFREEAKTDRAALQDAHTALATAYQASVLDSQAVESSISAIEEHQAALHDKLATALTTVHETLDRGQRLSLSKAIGEMGPMRVVDPRHGYGGERPRFGAGASPTLAGEGGEPTHDKPSDDKPAREGGEPADKPAREGGEPADDKPAREGGEPAGDKPADDKPAREGGEPTGDKPAGDKPADDKPADDKPDGAPPA